MARVGILTWHYYSNVGSNLQAWAMQHVLEGMGFDARFVNYRKRELDGERFPRGALKAIVDAFPFGPRFDTWRFQRDEFRQTRKTYSPEEACKICDGFDAVICGSDQIWAPNVFDPVYMLEGVSEAVRKVAYAASIGLPTIPERLRSEYKRLLSKYDAIGVREEHGRKVLHSELGIDATAVLDPSFLVPRGEWLGLASVTQDRPPYVFCYFLGAPARYKEAVASAARATGLPVIAYLPEAGKEEIPGCLTLRKMAVPEFLSWLGGAALVMTDSFHGIALSINLGVEFLAYRRFDDNDVLNQNSRVLNVLSKLNLEDHLMPSSAYRVVKTDWAAVAAKLETEISASRSFLEIALSSTGVLNDA